MYCDGPLYGEVIRISERGQITIPKQLRDQFGLTHNVEVEITPTEKGLLVRKHTTSKHPVDRGARNPGQRRERRRLHRGNPRKMITAVDTNVHLDVFLSGAPHGQQSREWLRDAYDRGAIRISNVVYTDSYPYSAIQPPSTAPSENSSSRLLRSTTPWPTRPGCVGCATGAPAARGNGSSPTSSSVPTPSHRPMRFLPEIVASISISRS